MAEENGDLTPEGEETIAAEQERPDWLPQNFNSPEDLVKSYGELQNKLGTQGTELGELRDQMGEMLELMQQPAQTPSYTDPNQNPLVQEYQRAYEDGDATRMLAVQAQLTQAILQQSQEDQKQGNGDVRQLDPYLIQQMRDQVASSYDADDAMNAKAYEIMESHPVVSQRLQALADDPNATIGDLQPVVDTAYQLAKGEFVSQENQSLAQQQAEKEAARQRKIDSETLSSSGPGRPPTVDESKSLMAKLMAVDDGKLIIGEK